MKRLIVIALLLFCTMRIAAQIPPPNAILNASDAGTCSTAGACFPVPVSANVATAVFTVSGTFSGTIQFESSGNVAATWTSLSCTPVAGGAAVTSITGVGSWTCVVSALTNIRARMSTFSSGAASVTITMSSPVPVIGGGGIGGGGTASQVAGAGNLAQDAFVITTACGGRPNCLQLVDDDSTDNCGTPLTTFMAAINAYAGPGEPQLIIEGSGTGKSYKFATAGCHLEFDIPAVIHDFATIDFAQPATTANGVQFSPNNLVAQAANGIPKFDWDGGVFIGGANLTNAIFECEPFSNNCVITHVDFMNAGAGHASGGACTNWSILFDPHVFEGTVEYTHWHFNDSVVGRCGYWNNTANGSNTVFYTHNTMGGAMGNGIPPTVCSNVGIFEGGFYGDLSYNNLYGFDADIRTIGVGTRIDHNTLDSAKCTLGGVNAVIQYGGIGTADAVLQHSIEQNNVEGAHVTFLFAKAGDTGASTISDVVIAGNQGSNDSGAPPSVIDSSPCLISNVSNGTACYQTGNVAINTGNPGNGWCTGTTCGQLLQQNDTANVSAATVVSIPYGTNYIVTCQVILERAATTSSTLPTCAINWTDLLSSVAQSTNVTPTWASGTAGCSGSTTNTVGNSCQGTTVALAKATTNLTVTTSGYASSGATTMQYQLFVTVNARP